ncbi:MAG: hypothetical protein GTO51_09700 [Candidatus Latescibacteria bacterium]|nr:hypothetical protein [Candidatus Latescibacterota bacterium]NIM22203.1 hypothetical protein [Candidatus Latescibacterota bacterium]NIM66242.1 hypothetical protein [Candidatus Latescibacterota bacterium]NIO02318.1 hypothetical protein [Candidatus Latescibacterota bacterium]NIO29849.1 hypothetical protein [Candidatus Latescibacterota bacterium]
MKTTTFAMACIVLLANTCNAREIRGHLDTEHLPAYLRDRGEGVPISMFGTYIQKRQLIIYPYFEYYQDSNFEYAPNELGFTEDRDYRGDYEGYEWLLFVGYGLTDRLALEFEAAAIQAELETASDDRSGLPPSIEESGIGDVEGQLRYRWVTETTNRPEVFSYFETVLPTQDKGSLIGTTDWEFQLGTGVIRGFSWGTLTGRLAVEYDRAEELFEIGEYAVEYLKRLSLTWRVFGSVEGSGDEVELITEAQWHLSRNAFLKLNNAFGLTSKAPGWAPEVGVLLSF